MINCSTEYWAEKVKDYRVLHDLSQAEFASLVKISPITVSKIERQESDSLRVCVVAKLYGLIGE